MLFALGVARQDGESILSHRHDPLAGDGLDARKGRRFAAEHTHELVERLSGAFGFDDHAAGIVQHPAAQPEALREVIHVRAEANALDRAFDAESATASQRGGADRNCHSRPGLAAIPPKRCLVCTN